MTNFKLSPKQVWHFVLCQMLDQRIVAHHKPRNRPVLNFDGQVKNCGNIRCAIGKRLFNIKGRACGGDVADQRQADFCGGGNDDACIAFGLCQ